MSRIVILPPITKDIETQKQNKQKQNKNNGVRNSLKSVIFTESKFENKAVPHNSDGTDAPTDFSVSMGFQALTKIRAHSRPSAA